jgi:hypothetical protein
MQKYLNPFGSWQLSFKYAYKITQKAGSDYDFVARMQCGSIAYNAVLVHANINLSNQFIANWGWNSAETDDISHPAREVDVVQHLEAFKAGKYISWKQV